MKLFTYCKSCKKEIKIKSSSETRPDLQMEKGREFKVNCQNCGTVEKKHVNDVKAQANNIIIYSGIGLGTIASILLWIFYGTIASLAFAIPILIYQQQMNSVKSFNSYTVRR